MLVVRGVEFGPSRRLGIAFDIVVAGVREVGGCVAMDVHNTQTSHRQDRDNTKRTQTTHTQTTHRTRRKCGTSHGAATSGISRDGPKIPKHVFEGAGSSRRRVFTPRGPKAAPKRPNPPPKKTVARRPHTNNYFYLGVYESDFCDKTWFPFEVFNTECLCLLRPPGIVCL